MSTIDMNRIRQALPKRAKVSLMKKRTPNGNVLFLRCIVTKPPLSLPDFEMCKDWQREIIGEENIMEFYTLTEGSLWFVYLNRVPMEFINATDEDIKTYSGFSVQELTKS